MSHSCAAVLDVAVVERTDSCTGRRHGVKASCLPVPLLRSPTSQVSVKGVVWGGGGAFLSADSRLRGEYYKVTKIDHYDVVK